ncbi:MAG: hypothetical protein Q8T09_00280 [Candidatus Melainabacteria bacterium]|nr:hypothetical protein [Candidatus Melainabacteria bacterium]
MIYLSIALAILSFGGLVTVAGTIWFMSQFVNAINDPTSIELMALGYSEEQEKLAAEIMHLEQELEILSELPGAEYSIEDMKDLIEAKRNELRQLCRD